MTPMVQIYLWSKAVEAMELASWAQDCGIDLLGIYSGKITVFRPEMMLGYLKEKYFWNDDNDRLRSLIPLYVTEEELSLLIIRYPDLIEIVEILNPSFGQELFASSESDDSLFPLD